MTLRDDGLASDQTAGDAIYSAQWIPSVGGTYSLRFSDGDVVTVDVDPDLKPGFPAQAFLFTPDYPGGYVIHNLVGNIHEDPLLEIVVNAVSSGLYAWKPDGSLVPGWPVAEKENVGFPVMGSLSDEFPGDEVVSGHIGLPGRIVAYSGLGTLLPGWPRNTANYASSPPALADVDGDGLDEIFIGEGDWRLHAYKADGSLLPGWLPPVSPASQDWSTPMIADLDGDGDLEILATSGGKLFAFHHNGTLVNGFPPNGFFVGPVAIGDVDGDGTPEIIAATRVLSIQP
ncbi:MAG: VCBS repeat-containing protein, partial [Deltaproteobacteria bacterium]|nr:VCBS repeat-containing protein [Deltaproteobacteria bacterium]